MRRSWAGRGSVAPVALCALLLLQVRSCPVPRALAAAAMAVATQCATQCVATQKSPGPTREPSLFGASGRGKGRECQRSAAEAERERGERWARYAASGAQSRGLGGVHGSGAGGMATACLSIRTAALVLLAVPARAASEKWSHVL